MNGELSKSECVNIILRMRAGEKVPISQEVLDGISTSLPSLDDVMEEIDKMMQTLEKLGQTNANSICSHVDYMIKKGIDFKDSRFDNLFIDRNVSMPTASALSQGTTKKTSALLDYSYRGKLSGFISRSGRLEWDDEKINDFIDSLGKC